MSSNTNAPLISNIPEGYVIVSAADGQQYITPKFIKPAIQQALDADEKRRILNVDNAPGGSTNMNNTPYKMIVGDNVMIPCDPALTERELLGLHAEIKALQERLGISYKDASHRLYMAEVEKIKADENTHTISTILKGRTQKVLQLFKKHGREPAGEADAKAGAKDHDGLRS